MVGAPVIALCLAVAVGFVMGCLVGFEFGYGEGAGEEALRWIEHTMEVHEHEREHGIQEPR